MAQQMVFTFGTNVETSHCKTLLDHNYARQGCSSPGLYFDHTARIARTTSRYKNNTWQNNQRQKPGGTTRKIDHQVALDWRPPSPETGDRWRPFVN